jgi:allophanate hydrolase subunit 2
MGASALWEAWGTVYFEIELKGRFCIAGPERGVFKNGREAAPLGCFAVEPGDRIELRGDSVSTVGFGAVSGVGFRLPFLAISEEPIRILPLQAEAEDLAERRWTVSRERSRIGVRLEGEPLAGITELPKSEPAAPGVIQVPPSGLPIVLGEDGPTVGGYLKVASVIQADRARLIHASTVSFRVVGWEEAKRAGEETARELEEVLKLVRLRA